LKDVAVKELSLLDGMENELGLQYVGDMDTYDFSSDHTWAHD
jgi:hypothetical protein